MEEEEEAPLALAPWEYDHLLDIRNLPEDPWDWEEISLNLLLDSKIDQDYGRLMSPSWGRKRHRMRRLGKRPQAIPQVILRLQEPLYRESALRLLSAFLFEKREEDPENYYRTGLLLYNSCSTMVILVQEVLLVYRMMVDGGLTERASMRLINVIILFQCIAANDETRIKFVKSCMANFLIPLVVHNSSLEVYDNVRAVTLSVFGILCQVRESDIIQWALENDLVELCLNSLQNGNELTKVIGMYILEAILQVDLGIEYVFRPMDDLMKRLVRTWENLLSAIAEARDHSPRLLFHVIRCYILLSDDSRGQSLVKQTLPEALLDGSLHDILEEFPVINRLLQQLLLIADKTELQASYSINKSTVL